MLDHIDMPEEAACDFRPQSLTLASLKSELASFGNSMVRRILRDELEEFFHKEMPAVLPQVVVTSSETNVPLPIRDSKQTLSYTSERNCPSPSLTSCSSPAPNVQAMSRQQARPTKVRTCPEMALPVYASQGGGVGESPRRHATQTVSTLSNRSQNLFANRHIRTFTAATESAPDPWRRKEDERPMKRTPNLLEDPFPISLPKNELFDSHGSRRMGGRRNADDCEPKSWSLELPPMPNEGDADDDQSLSGCCEIPFGEAGSKGGFVSECCHTSATMGTSADDQKIDWLGVSTRIQSRRHSNGSVNAVVPFGLFGESARENGWHRRLLLLVRSPSFDYLTLSLISVNALTIGWQADYMARNRSDSVPWLARAIELGFCTAFTLEIGARIIAYGRSFFNQRDWRWNLFDCMVVGLQLIEEFLTLVVHSFPMNFSFLRIVRILRLVRVVRLIRLLRLIGELRTLVTSLSGSFKSFVWTIALLFGLIYTTGIFFTQLVTDHRMEGVEGSREHERSLILQSYFGSLDATILVLIQSILNGVAWREVTNPLQDQIHWMLALLFCVYITFCMMAMMNVVTGVFVDCALNSAKKDKEIYMVNSVRQMFRRLDIDLTGALTWTQFEAALDETEMREYFKQIDVDITEARGIFDLLDMDGSGRLSAEEFVSGCMRISGNAKALDSIVLLHELRQVRWMQARLTNHLESATLQWQQLSEREGSDKS